MQQKERGMSELATEISGAQELIATTEFIGSTFEERKRALEKVDAYRQMAQRALLDTVIMQTGQEVCMTFRPSWTSSREYNASFPCYSLFDDVREPLTRTVTVRNVDEQSKNVFLSEGELSEDRYDKDWTVKLGNIVAIESLAQQ